MGSKVSARYHLTPQLISAAKRGCQHPPFSSDEHRHLVLHANEILSSFGSRASAKAKSVVLTPWRTEDIERKVNQLKEQWDGETAIPDGLLDEYMEGMDKLWNDLLNYINLYRQLNMYRGLHLLDSFVRSSRTKEYFGMALASRALLELGVIASENLQFAHILMPKLVAWHRDIRSRKSVDWDEYFKLLKDEIRSGSQERLRTAIMGTRIGSSNLGDGKSKKGQDPTPLWQSPPFGDDYIRAPNVINAFQKQARRSRSNESDHLGAFSFKIYEILCDVVHPSFLGNQMLLDITVPHEGGEFTLQARQKIAQNQNLDWIVAVCIAGAAHGCRLIVGPKVTVEPELRSWIELIARD